MENNYKNIIIKAKELSDLIKNHEAFFNYQKSLEKIKNDADSQMLLENLILIGKELNEKFNKNEKMELEKTYELETIKNKFEKNVIARNHLKFQKEYLEIFEQVLDRIKNPRIKD